MPTRSLAETGADSDLLRRSSGEVEGRRGSKLERGNFMLAGNIPGGAEIERRAFWEGITGGKREYFEFILDWRTFFPNYLANSQNEAE